MRQQSIGTTRRGHRQKVLPARPRREVAPKHAQVVRQLQQSIGNRRLSQFDQSGSRTGGPTIRRETRSEPRAEDGETPYGSKIPETLRAGMESLSGTDLSGIRVHANSPKPARFDALAYTQGEDIHLGAGQEKHLPHETWHAVQQIQGRVEPTQRADAAPVNDDPVLEHEADVMGARAAKASVEVDRLQGHEDIESGLARGPREVLLRAAPAGAAQQRSGRVMPLQRQASTSASSTLDEASQLEAILGPKPTNRSRALDVETRSVLVEYLRRERAARAMSDPLWEQSMVALLEGYFPGSGRRIWNESKRPLAGLRGTAFGAAARKRLETAESAGLERLGGRGTRRRLEGADIIFFSGHHFARYGSPGEFEAIDLRDIRFSAARARLLMVSSCAALASNSVPFFRRRFPNATIFGWITGSPLKQRGLMRKFIEQLGFEVDVNTDDGIDMLIAHWRTYIERVAKDPKAGVIPQGLGYVTPTGKVTYYLRRNGAWSWRTQ